MDDAEKLVVMTVIVTMLISGGIGSFIAGERKRNAAGFILGFFLGPFGWIIAALIPGSIKWEAERADAVAYELAGDFPVTCGWCLMPIKSTARACRYCGHEVLPAHAGGRVG